MQFKDIFVGEKGSSIQQLVKNSTIMDVQEVSSSIEVAKKIDNIKKTVSKSSQDPYIIVVFRG